MPQSYRSLLYQGSRPSKFWTSLHRALWEASLAAATWPSPKNWEANWEHPISKCCTRICLRRRTKQEMLSGAGRLKAHPCWWSKSWKSRRRETLRGRKIVDSQKRGRVQMCEGFPERMLPRGPQGVLRMPTSVKSLRRGPKSPILSSLNPKWLMSLHSLSNSRNLNLWLESQINALGVIRVPRVLATSGHLKASTICSTSLTRRLLFNRAQTLRTGRPMTWSWPRSSRDRDKILTQSSRQHRLRRTNLDPHLTQSIPHKTSIRSHALARDSRIISLAKCLWLI